jgi:hypothetical protein
VAYRVLRTGETHAGATVNLSWQGLSLIGSAERGDELNIVLRPHGAASIRLVGIVRSLDPSSSSIGCSLERSKRAALDQLVLAITTEGARMQDAAEAYQWAAVDRTIAHDRGG